MQHYNKALVALAGAVVLIVQNATGWPADSELANALTTLIAAGLVLVVPNQEA